MLKATARKNTDNTWTGYVEVWDRSVAPLRVYSMSCKIKRLTHEDGVYDAKKDIENFQLN